MRRHQTIEELRLRGRAHDTIDAHVRYVRKLVEWAGVRPATLTAEHVRGFLVHLMDERHLSCSSHDVHVVAFKFFFGITLGRPDIVAFIPRRKVPMKLPTVLSQQQVAELIDAASTLEHRATLMTYAAREKRTGSAREKWTRGGRTLHVDRGRSRGVTVG